jgi:hypothetical protein
VDLVTFSCEAQTGFRRYHQSKAGIIGMNRMIKFNTFITISILLLILAACDFPGSPAPTPFVFTTPDRTLTAIYAPLLTLTPEPVQAHTATPAIIVPSPILTTDSSPPPNPSPTLTSTATRLAPQIRSGDNIEAIYLDSQPNLDGNLSEWDLPSYPVRSVVYGAGARGGDEDLAATVMVGWDSSNLYLGVRISDDRYVQEARGIDLFKGDSLEILIDADLGGDFNVSSLNSDDYQLGISPGSPYPGENSEAYLWYPSSRQGNRPEVRIAARAREGGYDVEAVVPWSLFGISPASGDAYGFAFSVSDNDQSGEQVQESMVSTISTRRLADPTTWGSLLLVRP